jgi:hypothetical protein
MLSMFTATFSNCSSVLYINSLKFFKVEIIYDVKNAKIIIVIIKKTLKIENKMFVIIVVSIFLFNACKSYAVVLNIFLQTKNRPDIWCRDG